MQAQELQGQYAMRTFTYFSLGLSENLVIGNVPISVQVHLYQGRK